MQIRVAVPVAEGKLTVPERELSLGHVLLVDDSRSVLGVLAAPLIEEGWHVQTADSGGDAIEKVGAFAFDVVVCDLHMPDPDGIAVLRAVTDIDRTIPVVMLSSDSGLSAVLAAVRQGAFDYVPKENDTGPLLAAVQRAANHSRILRENIRLADALHHANEDLERRVDERAAELKARSVELELSNVDLRQTQSQLEQALVEAQAATTAKSQFLANMSHEIRTPMNGVIGMLTLVEQTDITPRQREYLALARTSANSLLGIIGDILDSAKMEAGKFELASVPFALRATVENAVRLLAGQAQSKDVEFQSEIASDVPQHVVGDEGRFRQILLNLGSNAIKFAQGRDVQVAVGVLSRTPNELKLQVAVRDSGIGMSAEEQKNVFDPFSQADGSSTRGYGGTGLGLSISRQLVEMQGGDLWVESKLGVGSTFYFTVCFGAVHEELNEDDLRGSSVAANKHVLLIDSDTESVKLLTDWTETWGAQVTALSDWRKALNLLESFKASGTAIHAIVLETSMPAEPLNSVLSRLWELTSHTKTRFILLAGIGQEGGDGRREGRNADVFLSRPLMRRDYVAALSGMHLFTHKAAKADEAPQPVASVEIGEGYDILVAEDNDINRRLVVELLRKRGHRVTAVTNGEEAVASCTQHSFAMILMDVQMPVLDGVAATREIRAREQETGEHVPILALTAHAMKDDEEHYLAQGMDAYLSKPIDAATLFATVDRLGAGRDAEGPLFDEHEWKAALDRMAGDENLLKELLAEFAVRAPEWLEEIIRALEREELSLVAQLSHRMRGAALNVGLKGLGEAAATLETAATAGNRVEARQSYLQLADEVTYARNVRF